MTKPIGYREGGSMYSEASCGEPAGGATTAGGCAAAGNGLSSCGVAAVPAAADAGVTGVEPGTGAVAGFGAGRDVRFCVSGTIGPRMYCGAGFGCGAAVHAASTAHPNKVKVRLSHWCMRDITIFSPLSCVIRYPNIRARLCPRMLPPCPR